MDELEAGVEFPLAVFQKSSALLEPGEGALDDPALGEHNKGDRVWEGWKAMKRLPTLPTLLGYMSFRTPSTRTIATARGL